MVDKIVIPIIPVSASKLNSVVERVPLKALPPLALYIHIPWCIKKCPYCDFNSHEAKDHIPEELYIDALVQDVEYSLPQIWGRKIHTIFFGGGTPSVLSAQAVDSLLSRLRALLPLEHCTEITLEANPGTFEAAKFEAYRQSGINRLSIGIQSFSSQYLKKLGRVHTDQEAFKAVEIAQRYFDNFNLDLMYALPDQSFEEAIEDIKTAARLSPTHLSAYQLTLEPNTLFYRYPPQLPGDDAAEEMQTAIEQLLADAGYQNYETSAFAKPGWRCKHNLNYWQFGDYLGIGAGAASKISFPDRILRSMRHKQPKAYLENIKSHQHVMEEQSVSLNDLPFEFMMNALRMHDGFPIYLFEERTGLSLNVIAKQLREARQKKLIYFDSKIIKPTAKGRRFLNDLLQLFLSEEV